MQTKRRYSELDAKSFAMAWGIVAGGCVLLTSLVSILGLLPQYSLWATNILENVYGPFGYSQGFLGLVLGTVYSFIDVFIISFIFALIYNRLAK